MNILLAGGSGDSGVRLAPRLLAAGAQVVISTRQAPQTLADRFPRGVTLVQGDPVREPEAFAQAVRPFGPFDAVVNLLAAFIKGDPRGVVVEGTKHLLQAVTSQGNRPRFVQCSTTTVYGHRPGEWLTEESPTRGDLRIGQLEVEGENILLQSAALGQCHPVILRLPHIYGPGRNRSLEMMARGEFLVFGDGLNPMHHLYVEDFIEVLFRAVQPQVPWGIYNIVEDVAEPYGAFCDFLTDWCGVARLPRVRYEEALATGIVARYLGPHMNQPALLRELFVYMTSEAVLSNRKMREHLCPVFRYPTFREGLAAMLTAMGYTDRRVDRLPLQEERQCA
jgi:nucleoside-diphosphate-sugar epimerase